jgi:hypothetical protein
LASLPRRTVERGLDVMRETLREGGRANRAELTRAIVDRGVVKTELDTIPIFMAAELELVIISGGLAGKTHTYALVDEIVPASADGFDRDQALGELASRYFTSHGPATIADFTWWSSLTVADTRRGIEIAVLNGRPLERLRVDGTDYWWAGDTSDSAFPDDPSPTIHLMQAYDEYIVAYRSPRKVINISGAAPPSGLNRPPMLHAVVLDGQLVGWWRKIAKREVTVVETAWFADPSPAQREALVAAAARYGAFVGANVEVSVSVSP